jgi:benzil reductase ((S)-benzoin forming)
VNKLVIITGANRGLGKAIADLALQDSATCVISLSRAIHPSQQVLEAHRFKWIPLDLTQPFDEQILVQVKNYLNRNSQVWFFNNAGIVTPIAAVGELDPLAIAASIQVNVTFPAQCINFLLALVKENPLTVINISSGAGVKPIAHWGIYCASKAFMKMYFKVLVEENSTNTQLKWFDIDPGVMDTGMQETIRQNEFPRQAYFSSLKNEEQLATPEIVAARIFEQIAFNG